MAYGIVKWFSNTKGYGFVATNENQKEDIFAHFSNIEMEGYKKLLTGQRIEFNINNGPKGLQAQNIRALAEDN